MPSTLNPDRLPRGSTRAVHQALRRFYGRQATFDSSLQSDALALVLSQTQPGSRTYIVLGTGSGKSLLYQLPAALRPMDIYLVVAPYRALEQDIHRRCRSLGLPVCSWAPRTSKSKPGIVTVGLERASHLEFRDWVQQAYSDGAVKMIFNDEAHTATTAPYRKEARTFCELQHLDVPTVHLTATLPPSMYARFEPTYGSMCGHKVLRACSQRLNIRYEVRTLEHATTEEAFIQAAARAILQDHPEPPYGRTLIYCRFKEGTY